MSAARSPVAVRLYRALLALLLPTRFHRAFADDMTHVFCELHAAARTKGALGGALALLAELPGLARLAATERRRERIECAHMASSPPREQSMLDSLAQDLRFTVRSLAKSPGFALVAILTLALGVGANTAIFSLVNGVLLKPLALPEPRTLVALGEVNGDGPDGLSTTSPGSFFDWKSQARAMRLAAYGGVGGTITGRGDPERLLGTRTVGGLFEMLGVTPLFGRTIRESDEDPAADEVIVLSHATWRRLYGEDRGVVGTALTVNGTSRTIVGVMPADFRFPGASTEFWIPARFDAEFRVNRDQYFLFVVGRLAPGATIERARVEMETVAARLRREWPLYNTDLRIGVLPLHETVVGSVRGRLAIVMGAVVFVLLITCANLGNLLLARASSRRREMAIRQALGAGRGRVARQLLTESLVLALLGGAAGVLVGKAFLELLLAAQATTNLPRAEEIALDQRVLLFTLAVSVLAGLFFGSLPAWKISGARSIEALREGARGSMGHQWTRRALVVSELALAMVLLTGAGLLVRSFALLQRVDPGIRSTGILTFTLSAPEGDPSFVERSLARVREIPGVRAAAATSQLPVTGRGIGAWYNRLDRPPSPDVTPAGESYRVVTPQFFATVGIPLRRGRLLAEDDGRERPVVVINEALAAKYYAGEDPIGKEIYLGAPDNRLFERGEIVGIVGDTRDAGLGLAPLPTVYVPLRVMPEWRGLSYVVRTAVPPLSVAAPTRAAIREVDPSIPVWNVRAIDAVLAEAVAPAQWSMTLLGVFAAVALLMAALGVFGVLSYTVTQRTRELGIRLALGAAPAAVRRMVVGQGLALVAIGVALGLAGSFALTRLMTGLLYGVAPTDPVTFAVVAAVLVLVAASASYLPARRATRVDPLIALRAE